MAKRVKLGELEIMVLSAILNVGDQGYGLRLCEEIADRTDRKVSVGAMYTTLYRLERKGMVTSETGEPGRSRGGRAKRFFHITSLGTETLHASLRAIDAMTRDFWPQAGAL